MADDSEGQKRSTPDPADGAEKTMSDTADLDRDALVVDDEVVAADAEVIPESAADADVVVATEQVTTEQTSIEEPAAADAPARVVFVETPAPPRNRGNRVAGAALALLGAVVFAFVYALAVFVLIFATEPSEFVAAAFSAFLSGAALWIPVLFFALSFLLAVLMLNRAGWWVHIVVSLVVGAATYFGSIGLLLLVDNVVLMSPSEASDAFVALALDPRVIIAALAAREVSIWIGLAVAARGRRVKARNLERRAEFERELAEKKAERERAAASST